MRPTDHGSEMRSLDHACELCGEPGAEPVRCSDGHEHHLCPLDRLRDCAARVLRQIDAEADAIRWLC